MGIYVKKKTRMQLYIYQHEITRDYTVYPTQCHHEHSDATSCLDLCRRVNSYSFGNLKVSSSLNTDSLSACAPPWQSALYPWQRGLLKEASAKGIRTDNVHVMHNSE
jgi:hypothetical protein